MNGTRVKPPIFPKPPRHPPAPVRGAPLRHVPPAIFPPLLGLLGLGLAWRTAAVVAESDAVGALAELVLGAATLVYLFALGTYGAKLLRRPAALAEDLRVLPGRAGVTAAVLAAMVLAAALMPYRPGLAMGLALLAVAVHLALAMHLGWTLLTGPAESRGVTPVWHLALVGTIVAAPVLAVQGQAGLAWGVLWGSLAAALLVWGLSVWQLLRRIPPAPLRPLLAIHAVPACMFALTLAALGAPAAAQAAAALAAAVFLALLASLRWICVAGFSPMWGAFTFALAALSNAFLTVGWLLPGAATLVLASAVIPWVALRILRGWLQGRLGATTNAAPG